MNQEIIQNELSEPLALQPDNFTDHLWGGDWIPRFKSLASAKAGPVGESWEFSGRPERPSQIQLGKNRQVSLCDLLSKFPIDLLGQRVAKKTKGAPPFLLKFIDAQDNLSVQVHPSDDVARAAGEKSGKSESWVVLDVGNDTDEGFIYIGFNPQKAEGYKNLDEFREAFLNAVLQANAQGPSDDPVVRKKSERLILPFLNQVPVKPGEVYELRPGTIHAIGRGVRLFEIQQNSDVTYRVWDWNRPDAKRRAEGKLEFRPLHLDRAKAALDFVPRDPASFRPVVQKSSPNSTAPLEQELIREASGLFGARRLCLPESGASLEFSTGGDLQVITSIRGNFILDFSLSNGEMRKWGEVSQGHSVLLPARLNRYRLTAKDAPAEAICSYVP